MKITLSDLAVNGEAEAEVFKRLLATNLTDSGASVYRTGQTLIETNAQRLIWQTGAGLAGSVYLAAQDQGAELFKIAVATIDGKTTRTCLGVHGQVRRIDEPFELTARPRFGRYQQHGPFHWRCRTNDMPYHPKMATAGISIEAMREQARAELRGR